MFYMWLPLHDENDIQYYSEDKNGLWENFRLFPYLLESMAPPAVKTFSLDVHEFCIFTLQ